MVRAMGWDSASFSPPRSRFLFALWAAAVCVLAAPPAAAQITDEDAPPIPTACAWASLRQSLANPYVYAKLSSAVRDAPLVAISSKSASSSSVDTVCLRFHFQAEARSTTVRFYTRRTAGAPAFRTERTRQESRAEAPSGGDRSVVAADAEGIGALGAALRDEALDAEVRRLLPHQRLVRIALVEDGPTPEGEHRFRFLLELEPAGGCEAAPVRLAIDVIRDPAGAARTAGFERLEEGQDGG